MKVRIDRSAAALAFAYVMPIGAETAVQCVHPSHRKEDPCEHEGHEGDDRSPRPMEARYQLSANVAGPTGSTFAGAISMDITLDGAIKVEPLPWAEGVQRTRLLYVENAPKLPRKV